MNNLSKLLILFVVITMLVGCFAACGLTNNEEKPEDNTPVVDDNNDNNDNNDNGGNNNGGNNTPPVVEFVDYASQVKFNENSGKVWAKVSVKSYIDGDTTHFYVDEYSHGGNGPTIEDSYVKARYLAINTPESTGVIEPWGKKASNYTKTQLSKATDIIIESDTATWNLDSTGGRYLLWVWYKTAQDTEYRNLNLEILQQGLAYGSNVGSNTYAQVALAALNQAKTLKLHVFSKDKDPDFYYGKFTEVTLKELKVNAEKYEGRLVKFEAVVAKQVDATLYVQEYDAATDMYFGLQVFCSYNYPRMSDFFVGNRVSFVGTLQYYENGGYYQLSNLQYDVLDETWEGGCHVIGTGYESSYPEIDVNTLMNGTHVIEVIEEVEVDGEVTEVLVPKTFKYGEFALHGTASLTNLTVQSVYTTVSDTDSNGALTITCKDANGMTIKLRTDSKLVTDDGHVVVEGDFPKGTVLSAKGIVDVFNGQYQLKVFSYNDITIH